MDYLNNLRNMLVEANKKSLSYGDPKAWDNKKKKNRKRHCPRGPAFRKLEQQVWFKMCSDTLEDLEEGLNALS